MKLIEPRVLIPKHLDEKGDIRDYLLMMAKRARSLKYLGMIVDLKDHRTDNLIRMLDEMNKNFINFRIYTRITIAENDRSRIKNVLNDIRSRMKTNLICLESNNEEILNFVAKDERVDIIRLPDYNQNGVLNAGVTSLASQYNTFIEIPFNILLQTRGSQRSRIIRTFNKIIKTCQGKRAKMLISGDVDDVVLLKNPWQKAITCEVLLDVDKKSCRKIIYNNPQELVSE
ncbi:MAG: RNase P subunit p30 family protein [Promethearchaeota archaeon]